MLQRKIIRGAVLAVLLPFLLISCQDLFTKSAFTWAATDVADMSTEQKIAYAEDVAKSGDSNAMLEAFEALKVDLPDTAEEDPDLYLLVSDLAMGGSGLPGAITGALDLIPAEGEEVDEAELAAAVEELIAGIDGSILTQSVDLFADVSAVSGMEENITESQYTNAAVAQLFVIYNDPEPGAEDDPSLDSRFSQVEEWAALGGLDTDSFMEFF